MQLLIVSTQQFDEEEKIKLGKKWYSKVSKDTHPLAQASYW